MENERTHIAECILAWAMAKDVAKDNAELLLKDWSANQEKCVQRMKEIDRRQNDMMQLVHQSNLPAPLVRYIKATDDCGCSGCWSSSSGPLHPECTAKIDEFFTATSRLVEYGLGLKTS